MSNKETVLALPFNYATFKSLRKYVAEIASQPNPVPSETLGIDSDNDGVVDVTYTRNYPA
jgi:hypothetical protein